LPPTTFVNFLQNHDQIGNRPLGDRLESIAASAAIEAALAITLIAPMTPMLFMGEEFGSKTPFPFFCDFKGGLADAVRKGRRSEYEWAYAKYGDEIPDPLDMATFDSAVLDWDARNAEPGRTRLNLVRDLLAVRHREIAPRLANAGFGEAYATDDGFLSAHWRMGDGKRLHLMANLSDRDLAPSPGEAEGTLIWGRELKESMPPSIIKAWAVSWRIG
jgi:maltooligosyltrehalose trehalohydrolase